MSKTQMRGKLAPILVVVLSSERSNTIARFAPSGDTDSILISFPHGFKHPVNAAERAAMATRRGTLDMDTGQGSKRLVDEVRRFLALDFHSPLY